MLSFAHTLFFFAVALSLLIAVHEYGHYWVARRLGVKVLRFSLGFGKVIWRRQKSRNDTEFTLSLLPLGGYVRMVDESEGEVPPEERPFAFNRKPVMVRTAIVAAGPIANFLLAIVVFWLSFVWGDVGLRPLIGELKSGTLAEQAGFHEGEEIIRVGEQRIFTWHDAIGQIMEEAVDHREIPVTVKSAAEEERTLTLEIPRETSDNPTLLYQRLGLEVKPPEAVLDPVVERIIPGSAAEEAGLEPGDRILRADDLPMHSWNEWVAYVRVRPDQAIAVDVEKSGGVAKRLTLTPRVKEDEKERIGYIGAAVEIPEEVLAAMRVEYRLGPIEALQKAIGKTTDYSILTLKMIGRMVVGDAAVDNLSGPISIAQYAGKSASYGFSAFMKFLAMVSVSLAVLNLIPIPVLDGGHLLFYLIEALKGSPVSIETQMAFQRLGFIILISLMLFASYLDVGRLLGN